MCVCVCVCACVCVLVQLGFGRGVAPSGGSEYTHTHTHGRATASTNHDAFCCDVSGRCAHARAVQCAIQRKINHQVYLHPSAVPPRSV